MGTTKNSAVRLSAWLLPLALVISTACELPDTVAPQITIDAPTEGTTTAARMPRIEVSYSDDGGSGIDTGSLSVTVDGKQTAVDCDATATGATCFPESDLPPGTRTITASIQDTAGNEGSDTGSFELIDALPPMLMLAEPTDMVTTSTTPDIRVTYTDGNGVGIDTSTFRLALDGTDITGDCDVEAGEALCTVTTPLGGGMHNLDAAVSDTAGNERTMAFMFSVVLSLSVSIDTPEDELLTTDDSLEVSGTVDAAATSLTINNNPVPVSGGAFRTTVALHEGMNVITAIAEGDSGATGTDTVRVTRDTAAPTLVVDGPTNNATVASSRVTVTGTVQDVVVGPVNNANCTVRVSGRTGGAIADIDNGTWVVEDFELVMGQNPITVTATDAAGNQGAPAMITVNRAAFAGQRLEIVDGANQMGPAGTRLPDPVVVKATDANDQPLANRMITFQVGKNNGKLDGEAVSSKTVRTDENGEASVMWTLGDRAGRANNRLRVVAPGFAAAMMNSEPLPLTVCASGMAADCSMLVPDGGQNQTGVAGQPLAQPFVVTALDEMGNRCANQPIVFEAVQGGGQFANGEATYETTTGPGGFAMATLTLGMTAGINNNVVEASTPGGAGNTVRFRASAAAPGAGAGTTFTGVVMNTENEPIEGVVVSIHDAEPPVEGTTGPAGMFTLTGVPTGNQLLIADGRGIGAGMEEMKGVTTVDDIVYPSVEFVVDIVPNVENTLGRPIFLPELDPNAVGTVNEFSDTTLSMAGVDGFELRIFAGSATFPDGSREGQMSVTQVSNDQVPMPPNGGAAPPWVGTLQPAGVHFDPPVQVTAPNSLGLEPGAIVDMFSFDHELGMFIDIGTGTVQPDGATIVSDPGSGITVSGWFFDCPPPPEPSEIENTDDLLNNKDVQEVFQDALDDSNPGVMPLGPDGEHEEGGWLIQDENNDVRVQRWPTGDEDTISPDDPRLEEGEAVIGSFHTHPENPMFEESPSDADVSSTDTTIEDFGLDADRYLGCFVVSCNQIWRVDPDGNTGQVSETGPNPGD